MYVTVKMYNFPKHIFHLNFCQFIIKFLKFVNSKWLKCHSLIILNIITKIKRNSIYNFTFDLPVHSKVFLHLILYYVGVFLE